MMPISKPHSSDGGNNTGSSATLVDYLDKENVELEVLANNAQSREKEIDIRSRQQSFFNGKSKNISSVEVKHSIDNNKYKLGKNDAKYFAPTINFSKNELEYLAKKATQGRAVENTWQMNKKEFEKYNSLLQEYTIQAMDNYATNFNKQDIGVKSGNDLVYFAKIEHQRKYKGTDKEVVQGSVKSGVLKEGLQSHIHVVVSRKDRTQKIKLSPTANEKFTQRKIGNNSYTVGFDRKAWINANEKSFDQKFNYSRNEIEKFNNQNLLKNGSSQEIALVNKRIEIEKKKQKTKEIEL